MNTIVAETLNGSHIGRKTASLPSLLMHKSYGFKFAYITNIRHNKDRSVTVLYTIPPEEQIRPVNVSSAKPHSWQHHEYYNPSDHLVLEK